MLPPGSQAMVQGMEQGNQQAQSMLPSAQNPMGKAAARSPFEGPINTMKQMALELASGIGQQGDAYRAEAEKFYKFVYELEKINGSLKKLAEQGEGHAQS
jgi:hypothetical protein